MITLIAALDENNLIGCKKEWSVGTNNYTVHRLPWHVPEDQKFFKNITTGGIVIVGRKTWENLPAAPLKNRITCVISSQIITNSDYSFDCIHKTLGFFRCFRKEIFIIGGSQIYEAVLHDKYVDRMLISHIHGKFEGNVYFPEIDWSDWHQNKIADFNDFTLFEYNRIQPWPKK